jgi:hypothetical protein
LNREDREDHKENFICKRLGYLFLPENALGSMLDAHDLPVN